MYFTNTHFDDFDSFREAAALWDLDFNLLGKNDFDALLTLFSAEQVQIGRTSINGKVDQNGLCPEGFRSFVIPIDYSSGFVWLHKKVEDEPILVFPKDGTLDSVSFNGFDVYVVSIEEQYLFSLMDDRGYTNLPHLLSPGNELKLHLDMDFKEQFHRKADHFLSLGKISNHYHRPNFKELVHDIIDLLLEYLEENNMVKNSAVQRKRDLALKKASEYVRNHVEEYISISELCKAGGVSERTLEYAFRETYQVSPKEYIKSIKLNKVRSQLRKAYGQMVSSIAAQYGFWHMGQFAADFKERFGVLPSELQKNTFPKK